MAQQMTITAMLRAVAAGEMTIAEAIQDPSRHGAWRGYGLWNETPEQAKALWAIQDALPPDTYVAPVYDADVERMQTGRDPLDEGE